MQNQCLCVRKIIFAFILVAFFSLQMSAFASSQENQFFSLKRKIELQWKSTKEKINILKKKEHDEIDKLYKSQSKLETAQKSLVNCQAELDTTKQKINTLEQKLSLYNQEKLKIERNVAKRARQTYKGEKLSVLYLLLSSKDIGAILDNTYYQKRLNQVDKVELQNLRQKQNQINKSKQNIESEKKHIVSTIKTINRQKSEIKYAINNSVSIINKLRTDRKTFEAAERELARQSERVENLIRSADHKTTEKIKITGGFLRPIAGGITSPFGWRIHPIFKSRIFHSGIDIGGRNRGQIKAANGGRVIYSGWYGGYGKVVIVDHGIISGNKVSTLYAHLSSIMTSTGATIKKGQVIGLEGSTGYSTGPHLHFEVRINGKPTNPLKFVR